MSTLASEFGITDVGLAKRCRLVDVPIPYRGYWARVTAGQSPPKIPLPKYRTKTPAPGVPTLSPVTWQVPKEILREGDEPAIRFGLPTDPRPPISTPDACTLSLLQRLKILKLAPAATIADTGVAVRRTAKHHKHADGSAVRLAAAEREGLLIDIHVSKDSLSRALLLADRFIKTAEAIGWAITDPEPRQQSSRDEYRSSSTEKEAPPPPPLARLLVEGEPIEFLIEERWRHEPRVPTAVELAREKREGYQYQAPRISWIATGALRLVRVGSIHHWDKRRRTWYDHRNQLLETKVPQILIAFHELAQEIKAKRAKDEQEARERAEQERLRREREERRKAHSQLRAELDRQAGAWTRARFLRRYIAAARRTLPDKIIQAKFCAERINFLDWATEYADQLDPLVSKPLNPDLWPEPSNYPRPDEQGLRQLLLRLTGLDGFQHQKVAAKSSKAAAEIDETSEDESIEEGCNWIFSYAARWGCRSYPKCRATSWNRMRGDPKFTQINSTCTVVGRAACWMDATFLDRENWRRDARIPCPQAEC